jgi:hypothetical protein
MCRWAIAIILIFLALSAHALTADDLLPDISQRSVTLITFGPGEASYEKFGHNAIWIHDPQAQYPDVAFNYGVFDFESKNFTWNFIQGRMTYRIDASEAVPMIAEYEKSDRSITLQGLDLTPQQIDSLEKFLIWNVQPENQNYKYDYYRSNCSTKVRDAIDGVLDHQIQAQTSDVATGTSYRWHTRRLTADDLWLYAALDFVMGHPIDRPISRWEEMFLPVKMSRHLREIKVNGAPLVKWERQVYTSKMHNEHETPPSRWWMFLVLGVAVGIILALGARLFPPSERGLARRTGRWVVCLVALAWVILAGLGGAISTWGWFFTDHVVAKYNENLLQLNPITLPLIVLIPIAIFSKRRGKTVAFYLSVIGLALSILGFVLQILPTWNQPNGEIISLALPAHAGLAFLTYRLFKSQPATSKTQQAKKK